MSNTEQQEEVELFQKDNDLVCLVRTGFDGEVERTWLPPSAAVALAGYDPDNGIKWASARIVGDDVDMGAWDRSC